eukprot:gene5347-6669_t
MATLNPLNNKHTMARSHTMGTVMDENKIPAKTLIGMDNKGKLGGLKQSSRGALSDLTNNSIQPGVPSAKANLKSTIIMPHSNTNVISRVTRSKTTLETRVSNIPQQQQQIVGHVLKAARHDISVVAPPQQMVMIDENDMMIEDVPMLDAPELPENIDIYDAHDPQCVGEYVNEIFAYYREKELVDRINPNYIKDQYHINEKMRAILVDWMMAVHVRFKLLSETFFLSVNIVDRYLAKQQIPINKLQLVGITAILLASKYEEIYSPQIQDFVETSDNACTHQEVLAMERSILATLSFHMSTATPLHFLRRFSKAAGSDSRTHSLSKYLTELSMTEYKMLHYLPSMVAAASIYVARRMTMKSGPYWNITLEHYTCYKESEIIACAQDIKETRKRADTSTLKATKKKYMSSKLMEVANIPVVEF